MVKKAQRNSVRIISGRWKGRRIEFADAEGLRPSKDFIRETLFNWLAGDIAHSRCLDLYAGSGVLSFEVASRGAVQVVTVDRNAEVIACLQLQRQKLQADNIQIVHQAAEYYIDAYVGEPFDIVFLDPPFDSVFDDQLFERLYEKNLATQGTKVYLEQARRSSAKLTIESLNLLKEKRSGQVLSRLFQYA